MKNVLILDTDPQTNRVILEALALRSVRGTVCRTFESAQILLDQHRWELIFVHQAFAVSDRTGTLASVMKRIRSSAPEVPVVFIGDQDSSRLAKDAIRAGCTDFLPNPICGDELGMLLDQYVPVNRSSILAGIQAANGAAVQIAGCSNVLQKTIQQAQKVAASTIPVLIYGPSGSGKELLAHWIHLCSRRSEGPFVRVNCAALNESLLESELFGHEKGAFTGALVRHRGRFERAHGGTLLLDEISETPPGFQAKLLRVLEQMCFERVGGSENIQVNVRILSTTNRDLHTEMVAGRFREDLFYRLAGIRLRVPALRERKEDLSELIWLFVNQYAPESGRRIEGIDRQTLELFENCTWPGNVRQLRNVIRAALLLGSGPLLSILEIPELLAELKAPPQTADENLSDLAGCSLQELERRAILATLDQTEGNRTRAARSLGISDRTLRDKIRKYEQDCLLPTAS